MVIKEGKTNWKYILIVVILAAIVGGGTLYWQWWIGKQEKKESEKITEDKTANWKTYRNKEYGFELKYPTDWVFVSEAPERFQTKSYSKSIQCGPIEDIEFDEPNARLILPRYTSNILPFEDWFNEKEEHSFCREKRLTTIGGLPAIECFFDSYLCEFCSCYSPYYAYLIKDNETIEFMGVVHQEWPSEEREEIIGRNKEKRQLYFNLFRQILSTFRFLKPEDETINWETYRNEEHGFSFLYLSNYQIDNRFELPTDTSLRLIRKDCEDEYTCFFDAWKISWKTEPESRKQYLDRIKFCIDEECEYPQDIPVPSGFEDYGVSTREEALKKFVEDFEIQGRKGIKFDPGGLCGAPTAVIFDKNLQNIIFKIESSCGDIETLNQMLSSLRFDFL